MSTFDVEDEFRAKVAAQLRIDHIAESIWERAYDGVLMDRYEQAANRLRGELPKVAAAQARTEQREAVDEQAQEVDKEYNYVVDASNELRDGVDDRDVGPGRRGKTAPEQREPVEITPYLGRHEADRAHAFAEGIADLAMEAQTPRAREEVADLAREAQAPRAMRFRDEVLDGQRLTAEQARAFMRSPAVGILKRVELARLGISLATHTAWIEVQEEGVDDTNGKWRRFVVVVDPPGVRFPVTRRHIGDRRRTLPTLELPVLAGGDDRGESIEYWPGSVLERLYRTAQWLSRHFPLSEAEAAWLVLTGEPPRFEPLQLNYALRSGPGWQRATVTMTIEPWLPAATVAAAYRDVQRRVLRDRGHTPAQGLAVWLFAQEQERANRRQEQERASLHQEQERASRHRVNGPELCARWNEAHPDHTYKDYRHLHAARKRGAAFARTSLSPGYTPIGDAGDREPAPITTPIPTPKPADGGESPQTGWQENP